MTTLLDRVPLERINDRARDVRFTRALLTLLAGALYAVGWLTFKLCAAAWLAVAWCSSAVIEGWQQAKAGQRAP